MIYRRAKQLELVNKIGMKVKYSDVDLGINELDGSDLSLIDVTIAKVAIGSDPEINRKAAEALGYNVSSVPDQYPDEVTYLDGRGNAVRCESYRIWLPKTE